MFPVTKLEIIRFVKIAYAHEHMATDYTYTLEAQEHKPLGNGGVSGVMEIGMVRTNPLIFTNDGKESYIANEGDIFIIPPERSYMVTTSSPGTHRHITTEAIIEYRPDYDESAPTLLSLPLIIPSQNKSERIAETIKKIVSKSSSLHPGNYFEECSDYMRLLSQIRDYTGCTADDALPPSYKLYCTMAEKYAMENIARHIKVEEIASYIGISKNYLTNIFSLYKGMPITEYINRMKLNHMLELMLRFGYSARVAGEYVGIDNVNYISRMFRKYYGMTIGEYKRLHF